MTLLSLEMNDARLVLARGNAEAAEVVAESEGYAVIDGTQLLTGAEAKRRARLKPLYSYNRFWRDLSVASLPRGNERAQTPADLAFAHAESLLAAHRENSEGLLLALPAGYSREQLGLLLGVLNETGVPVCGLVDAAVAAVALQPSGERVLYLDLELHHAVLTLLEHGNDLRRSQSELLPRHGRLSLEEAWVEAIAVTFVRRTRFDPLHDARNEQALWNGLPEWIGALENAETTQIEIRDGETAHKIEFSRESLLAATQQRYASLFAFVQQHCPAGVDTNLVLSDRAAATPGLMTHLAGVPSVSVSAAASGAAALGTLRYSNDIRRRPGQVALVTRLPVPRTEPPRVEDATVRGIAAEDRPTHLLFQGRARELSQTPLMIGWSVPPGGRALQVPAGPGVSRVHCAIARRDGHAWLEDRSTYGTFLNGSPVRGAVALRAGDQIRLGSPGVRLDLIRVVDEDGAPSQL